MPVLLIVVLFIPLGLWLLWSGWSEEVGIRIAIGATLLFVATVVLGAFYVSSRLGGRRHRERLLNAAAVEVDLAPDGAARRVAGRKPHLRDDDPTAADGGADLDLDSGVVD